MKSNHLRKFQSKKDMVYESLREEILHGNLLPGTRLVIDELASEMDVSHIPVREALRQLDSEGFVEIRIHIGTFVSEIDVNSVFEIFSLPEVLEVVSGRSAAEKITKKDLIEL